jgi:hypothetical protein
MIGRLRRAIDYLKQIRFGSGSDITVVCSENDFEFLRVNEGATLDPVILATILLSDEFTLRTPDQRVGTFKKLNPHIGIFD